MNKVRIEEVALLIGVSSQTLNNWYRWKRLHPEHDLAKLLPEYEQSSPRQVRLWDRADIWQLVEFKNTIPRGRNGVLGEITQKARRKKKKENK